MIENETLIIKNNKVNSPHILSSGVEEVTLIGANDSGLTEQKVTTLPIGIRKARGNIRVLCQVEYEYDNFLDNGKGHVSIRTKMVGKSAFHLYVTHDLPDLVSRVIKIHWFGFGYEDLDAGDVDLTIPPVAGETTLLLQETFDASLLENNERVTLQYTPVLDQSLIIYADRVPMFLDQDFVSDGATLITFTPFLDGTENIVVNYATKAQAS